MPLRHSACRAAHPIFVPVFWIRGKRRALLDYLFLPMMLCVRCDLTLSSRGTRPARFRRPRARSLHSVLCLAHIIANTGAHILSRCIENTCVYKIQFCFTRVPHRTAPHRIASGTPFFPCYALLSNVLTATLTHNLSAASDIRLAFFGNICAIAQ